MRDRETKKETERITEREERGLREREKKGEKEKPTLSYYLECASVINFSKDVV